MNLTQWLNFIKSQEKQTIKDDNIDNHIHQQTTEDHEKINNNNLSSPKENKNMRKT